MSQLILNNLSKHIFWDVNIDNLDIMVNKEFIIRRVLQYGLFEDWGMIYNFYGINVIANSVIKSKGLDKCTASFIALLSGIPKEKFLCYTTKQSTLNY